MNTKNKTNRLPVGFLAGAAAAAVLLSLLLAGCGGGGGTSANTSTWPSATPPATSQTNTYVGTQSPGLYTVTIDHTNNTFSYQDLSTSTAAVSGTFTTTANGFLALSTGGYALEQLSRAVLLVPPVTLVSGSVAPTSDVVFAVAAPACQQIPTRTGFAFVALPGPYYGVTPQTQVQDVERSLVAGQLSATSSSSGQNWEFGTDTISEVPNTYSGTCAAASAGPSVIQTTLAVPNSISASIAVGPTGYYMEDLSQDSAGGFIGAFLPPSPVDLSQLSGATFLGTLGSDNYGVMFAPQLVSFSTTTASGTGAQLAGGAFPSNDPTGTPAAAAYTIKLGAQDPVNNGYFPSATITLNVNIESIQPGTYSGYALVSDAGGKYSIFILALPAAGQAEVGLLLFQQ